MGRTRRKRRGGGEEKRSTRSTNPIPKTSDADFYGKLNKAQQINRRANTLAKKAVAEVRNDVAYTDDIVKEIAKNAEDFKNLVHKLEKQCEEGVNCDYDELNEAREKAEYFAIYLEDALKSQAEVKANAEKAKKAAKKAAEETAKVEDAAKDAEAKRAAEAKKAAEKRAAEEAEAAAKRAAEAALKAANMAGENTIVLKEFSPPKGPTGSKFHRLKTVRTNVAEWTKMKRRAQWITRRRADLMKMKAAKEPRRKAEEEARRKAEEEARKKAEAEARRKAEEEAKAQAAKEAERSDNMMEIDAGGKRRSRKH
jgi:colicin import membrane protein